MSRWRRFSSLVLVGGGVEDERTFSTLTFVKNNLRSCLGEPHLNVCLRLLCSRDDYTAERLCTGRPCAPGGQWPARGPAHHTNTGIHSLSRGPKLINDEDRKNNESMRKY